MSIYKIITDKDDIILKKKDNKFKLEAKKQVKIPCNIISLAENLEIYNLFKLLNEKIINKCKIIKNTSDSDVIIFLNDITTIDNENADEENSETNKNLYITYANNIIKKNENSICLNGKKNHIKIDKDEYKKIEIDDIILNIDLINSDLNITLKFNFIGEKIPIYAENTIGLIFRKIIKNLLLFYSK
jgi:hypothetical protein